MTFVSALFDDPVIAHEFSDEQFIGYMLAVEVALAKVQSTLGIIPGEAAAHIEQASSRIQLDTENLYTGLDKAGIPTIELIKQLRAQVDKDYALYVHWGATSQDIMDTALVLQLRSVLSHIEDTLDRVVSYLANLADRHRSTLMVGRTHSQQALPITFGLKVAGWLAPLLRHRTRLSELKSRLLVVQFGGAVGTLASLGDEGIRVEEALAAELGLGVPSLSWHTGRDALAEFAGWLSLVTGSLAKMAQDIILMSQTEVGELMESADPSRGGSSTMPQKRNPMVSEMIIAAARTNASLLANMHHALVQEHERATHGWQMEWLSLPKMASLTSEALNKAVFLGENLVVDQARMQENVRTSNGLMLAEPISMALAPIMGRNEAKAFIKEACNTALKQGRHLVEVVSNEVNADIDWDTLRDQANYLGEANTLIDRVLKEAREIQKT